MTGFAGYADINGLHMYYETHGEGPPLLILHGGTSTIEFRRPTFPFFSKTFQVIAPEQMGHGRTADVPERAFHYHHMAEDTVELLRHLEIGNVAIIGTSDGGVIGLDIAIHHPDLVSKLVLTGANFSVAAYSADVWEELMTDSPDEWFQPLRENYHRLSPDGPSYWPVVFERMRRMWTVEPNFTREQLAGIKAQTLIIAGDQDVVEPEHTVALFRAIPQAQLCVVPNGEHGVLPLDTTMAFLMAPVTQTPAEDS